MWVSGAMQVATPRLVAAVGAPTQPPPDGKVGATRVRRKWDFV